MQSNQNQMESPLNRIPDEKATSRWAAILCGRDSSAALSQDGLERRTRQWAATHLESLVAMFSEAAQPLPEPFFTTRFMEQAASFDAVLEYTRKIFCDLGRGEASLRLAMGQLYQTFRGEESSLLRWKSLAEDRPRFLEWVPLFSDSYRYLHQSFPTPDERVEELRRTLCKAAAEPHRFLDEEARSRFDEAFNEFKRRYAEYYHSAHEDTVHIIADQEKIKTRVDSSALRNLEMLSEMDLADKSCLNRVRAIGKWIQSRQCTLPVREILLLHPRCFCNFNPQDSRLLADSIDQMNETIHQGISNVRAILRKCRIVIIQELSILRVSDSYSRQIASILSRGPMIPLKQKSVDILNTIMKKHPEAFQAAGLELQTTEGDARPAW